MEGMPFLSKRLKEGTISLRPSNRSPRGFNDFVATVIQGVPRGGGGHGIFPCPHTAQTQPP